MSRFLVASRVCGVVIVGNAIEEPPAGGLVFANETRGQGMLFRRRSRAPQDMICPPGTPSAAASTRRLSRRQRREQQAQLTAEAEYAARLARARRRLVQAGALDPTPTDVPMSAVPATPPMPHPTPSPAETDTPVEANRPDGRSPRRSTEPES